MLGERGIRGGVTGCRVKKVANLVLVDCMVNVMEVPKELYHQDG